MSANTRSINQIAATAIPVDKRLLQYPRYFGRFMLRTEATIFNFAASISDTYTRNTTGYWEMYSLSNGGFYMAPRITRVTKLEVVWGENYFEAEMSSDAFGVTVCLFSYSLMWESTQQDCFADLYHNLKAFSYGHAESNLILSVID